MEGMSKVIVIGSIHLDLVSRVSKIPIPGETVIGGDLKYFFGGKGANQAVAASRMGANVYMVGKVGGDSFAKPLIDNLKKNKINCNYILEDKNLASGIALIAVADNGENSIIVAKGASGRLAFEDVTLAGTAFSPGDYVLFQLEVPLLTVEKSITLAKMVDIITPNNTEISFLTGLPSTTDKEALNAAEKLRELEVKAVIMTRGKDGALCLDAKGPRYFQGYKVKAVDTTAAGDCFNGSLAACLAKGFSLDEAIDYATKAAALSVTKEGAQTSLPTWDEIQKAF